MIENINARRVMTEKAPDRIYVAIDLKSFYASVECVEKNLDPLTTNLVVADSSRTDKTICLAVSPSLKSYGVPGRPRLFEVRQIIREKNALRESAYGGPLLDEGSYDFKELEKYPEVPIDFIVATPRMGYYMEYSTRIYDIYLNYVAPEDIHVYSVDEVFIDVTDYLKVHKMTPRELTMKMIKHVLRETGITATAGIGTNMYLAKIAMDIEAKHLDPDENGVRLAELDEMTYRKLLWNHRPITDFWRVGKGYAKKLAAHGMYTMGDVARCSIGREEDFYNEDLLYKLFGVNAELLIDHAWGYEPCTMEAIKKAKPKSNSLSSGQVLQEPYNYEKTKIIVREMTDALVLDLVSKGLVCDQMGLTIGYDTENLMDPVKREAYKGEVTIDFYGREIPKHAHGTHNLDTYTDSSKKIMEAVLEIFERTVDPELLVRRVTVGANNIKLKSQMDKERREEPLQMDLFSSFSEGDAGENSENKDEIETIMEESIQRTLLDIKEKFGKNAVVKGTNLEEGATGMSRNKQIGGHKA